MTLWKIAEKRSILSINSANLSFYWIFSVLLHIALLLLKDKVELCCGFFSFLLAFDSTKIASINDLQCLICYKNFGWQNKYFLADMLKDNKLLQCFIDPFFKAKLIILCIL